MENENLPDKEAQKRRMKSRVSKLGLRALHYKDLRKSGLSGKTIRSAGIKSVMNANINKELGYKATGIKSMYGIPFDDEYSRFRLFYEQGKKLSRKGSISRPKYLVRKNSGNRLYIPTKNIPILKDASIPLYITEGEKKALKGCQEGLFCIAIAGLWNWKVKDKNELIADFDKIALDGRTVYLVPDNDWLEPNRKGERKNLKQAVKKLAYLLIDRGAKVYWRELPQGKLKGLDDYLCKHKLTKFDKLPTHKIRKHTIQEMIDSATPNINPDELQDIVKRIANIRKATEMSLYVNKLYKKTGVSKRSILSEIKKLCEKENRFTAIDADIVIAHPACEINRDFLSLGFRETVIINEKPVERNLYLISTNNDYILHDKPVLELHDIKIIFDIRERWLTNIADRWDKLRLIRFVKNPEAPKGLYKEIKRTLKEYIEFQNEAHYGLIAAWIMATYFNRCFHAFPFIFFYGKKQSGKSRALDVLERVVFNAMKVKGVSVAAMADSIDGVCGTFLNDQAEVLSDSRNVEILGILADSYTRGGGKRRIVSLANNSRKVVEFETYSPKAFASIKEIDADLKDRCIMYPMLRTKGDYPYPDAHLPIWKNLRDKLYRYLLCKWEEADEIYQTAGEDVTQRVRELWKPIETMLMLEHVPQMEMKAVKAAFLESMLETQTELSDYEESFFKVLLTMLKHTGGKGIFAVNEIAVHLKKGRDMTDKGIQTWTGRIISQFSLYDKHAGRRKYYDDQDRIRKGRAYYFSYDHVKDVYDRYQQTGGTGGQVGKKAKEKGNDHLTTKTTGYEPTKKEKFSNCVKMMRKLRGLGYEIKLDYSGADFNVLYSGKVTRGYGKGRILIKLLKKNKKMVVKKLKRETQQGNK